jgi:hypothetical protein
MPFEIQLLSLAFLFCAGLVAALWLCLSTKSEFRNKERQLQRRISLLEERLEQTPFGSALRSDNVPLANAQNNSSSRPALELAPPKTAFAYEVPLAGRGSIVAPSKPYSRTESTAEMKKDLNPEQLDFLASLRAGV